MDGGTFQLELKSLDGEWEGTVDGIGFILLVRGNLNVEVGGNIVQMEPDNILVINNDDTYKIEGDSDNLALYLLISNRFIQRNAPEMTGSRYDCNSQSSSTDNSLKNAKFFNIKKGLVRMMLAYYRREESYMLEVRHALIGLLYELHVNFRSEREEDAGGDNSIRNAVTYIHRNFRESFTLDELAMAENMSPQYFSKKFKQKMGVGFLEFVNRVRLKNAAYELMHTNDTMLRIAVNNGFANAKAFDAVFRKHYGISPKAYRMEKGNSQEEDEARKEFSMSVDRDENLGEMLKYIVANDLQNGGGFHNTQKKEVDMSGVGARPFSLPCKIFRVGRMSELLDFGVREQTKQANDRLHGDYMYFRGVFDDGIASYREDSIYHDFDYESVLLFIRDMGLAPFVCLDISKAPKSDGDGPLVPEMTGAVGTFVDIVRRVMPRELWERSLFEVVCSDPEDEPHLMECYTIISRLLKGCSEKVRIGIRSISNSDSGELEKFEERLIVAKKLGHEPDFATISIDPLQEKDLSVFSESLCLNFKNYGASQLDSVWHAVNDCGSSLGEIYVTEWNTLSGQTPLESASFFRNALMASELVQYADKASGATYWVTAKSKEIMSGELEARTIGLFLYDRVERPPYYLLSQMNKLGSKLIHSDEYTVVTMNDDGDYAIMLMNPRYFNPVYSFDVTYEEIESVQIDLELKNLKPGRYTFKVFAIEKKHCEAFEWLAKAGVSSLHDEDVLEHMAQSVKPDFGYFDVDVEGDYTISHKLRYNSVAVYEIKRDGD